MTPRPPWARRLWAAPLLALLALGNGVAEAPPVAAALDAVQARYDAIRDMRATFVQTSYTAALARERVAEGNVTMLRPGRVRWEYSTPEARVIVLDTQSLRIYSPLDEQLQVTALAKGTVSPTALSFLLGDGVLREQFNAERIEPQGDAPGRPQLGLRLRPREEASFEYLDLWVDAETYQLRESVLVDLFKNRTSVRFETVQENVGVDASAFELEVPEGTEVIDLR